MPESLFQTIQSIVKSPVTQDVIDKIIEEGITLESFSLLSEEDLKEIGFKLGARKLILNWIHEQKHSKRRRTSEEVATCSWKITSDFFMRHIDPDHGLLDKLQRRSVFSFEEIESIKAKKTCSKKNAKLLSCISCSEQFKQFTEALREADQTHIANYLEACGNYNIRFGKDWPLTEKEESILDANEEFLIDHLDVDSDLLTRLYTGKVINRRQQQTIASRSTPYERNESLLTFIRRCSMESYWTTVRCLHRTCQSHIAAILDEGGVVIPIISKVDGHAEDLNEIELKISTALSPALLDKMTNVSAEKILKVLENVSLKIIAAKTGKSIILFVYCKTMEDLKHLEQLIASEDINLAVKSIFVSIVSILTDATIRVHFSKENFKEAKHFLKFSEFYPNHPIQRLKPTECVKHKSSNINYLPQELLDIILHKSIFASSVNTMHRHYCENNITVIEQLSSVNFFWFESLRRRRFKSAFWCHLSAYYKTKHHRSHNINLQFYVQNIQFSDKLKSLKDMDLLTDVECSFLNEVAYAGAIKKTHLFRRRLALMTQKIADLHLDEAFRRYLHTTGQERIAKVIEEGGAAVKVEIKRPNYVNKESKFPICQNKSNIKKRETSSEPEGNKIINKRLRDYGLEILNSAKDRNIICWLWCKTKKSLEALKWLDNSQRLGTFFRLAAENDPSSKNQINFDRIQLKTELGSSSASMSAKFLAKIDMTKELSTTDLIFGVTVLKSKIYVLCRKTDHLDYSNSPCVIYVLENDCPFPSQHIFPLKGVTHAWDIGANEQDNSIYVTESSKLGNNFVWKITIDGQIDITIMKLVSFGQAFRPTTLSVSKLGRLLLISQSRPTILRVYGSDGELSRCLNLPEEIRNARHAVETSKGTIVILHATLRQKPTDDGYGIKARYRETVNSLDGEEELSKNQVTDRLNVNDEIEEEEDIMWVVSEIGFNAKEIIRQFSPRNREQMLGFPIYTRGYLCLDSDDRVLVADIMHHRVILLDPNLQWNRILVPTKEELAEGGCQLTLRRPRRMFIDEKMKRLFVAGGFEGDICEEINIFTTI